MEELSLKYKQKLAAIRTLRDIMFHGKLELENSEMINLLLITKGVMKATDLDLEACMEMNNAVENLELLGSMDIECQKSFRKQMRNLVKTQYREPKPLEIEDIENFLSLIPNPFGLPITFDSLVLFSDFNDSSCWK